MSVVSVKGNKVITTPEEMNDSSRVVDLDEVVVVSQPKDAFRLRLQPTHSVVFGEKELKHINADDLSRLSAYVPSFTMPVYGSRLTSSVYMRGTGSRMNTAAPSVPIYYDNIPLVSKSAFNTHFYMLDRVDVLHGPQATLYGMNSEGGLVRVFSKNPMNYQGTDVNLGLATGLQRRAEVGHFQRPFDNFAYSVSMFYYGQDGFFYNDSFHEQNDKINEVGARLRLLWYTTQRLHFDLTADYQFSDQNGFPYGKYVDGKVRNPATSTMNTYRRNMLNTGLTVSYRANTFLITSTTSYQHLYDKMNMDNDYTPAELISMFQRQRQHAFTEELSLHSKTDCRWQWTFGAFGSYQNLDTDAPVVFGSSMKNSLASMLQNMLQGIMPPTVPHSFARMEIPAFYVAGDYKTPRYNVGVFHESNIKLTDRLTATLGLRYENSRVKLDYEAAGRLNLDYDLTVFGRSNTYNQWLNDTLKSAPCTSSIQWLPKVGLTYVIDDKGSNIYALFSKGFRDGGYNIQGFSSIIQPEMMQNGRNIRQGDFNVPHTNADYDLVNKAVAYEPETSWNYEVGGHLNLLDNKLHADITGYFMQVKNLQLTKMEGAYGFGRMVVNAGKSHNVGAEVSLRGSVADDHLSWAASYSYTHATFRDYTDQVKSTNGNVMMLDYKGKKVPYIPMHMFAAMADYRFDIHHDEVLKSITLGANVTGQGKIYWDDANTTSQKLYATLGTHVALDMGCVSVNFWGRNITDTNYLTFVSDISQDNSGNFYGQRGLPFQLGVDVSMNF
ncbi:MAG: TonB-dependent receptor [Prevotella sp.]|nr:TonB-dependent receptor [Prevotella sp.]